MSLVNEFRRLRRLNAIPFDGSVQKVSGKQQVSHESVEEVIARSLARDYIRYTFDGFESSNSSSKYDSTLRRVGRDVEAQHGGLLRYMVHQLEYNPISDGGQRFYFILNALFKKGFCNWGRIVMVYVFAAILANDCLKRTKDPECVETIGAFAGDYVAKHLMPWIKQNGGWVCIIHLYRL